MLKLHIFHKIILFKKNYLANLFCTGFFHLHSDRCLPFRSTRCNYYGLYKYGSSYCQCSFFFYVILYFSFLFVCFHFFLWCIWSSIFACVLFGSQLLVFFPQISTVNSDRKHTYFFFGLRNYQKVVEIFSSLLTEVFPFKKSTIYFHVKST
jgi:hypothetical protein